MPLLQIIQQVATYFLTVRRETDRVYLYAPLTQYPLKKRLVIRIADLAFFVLIKFIGKTVRFEKEGWEHLEKIGASGKVPIYAFWHDRIFLGTYYFRDRGIVVITSQSMDGEYIARFIQRLGYGAVRGSSTRGGTKALVEMIRLMRSGLPMGFTVDGPKGPPHEAKPGPILLAKKTGNPVLPFIVEARNYWTVNSWDKLQIPRPFTTAKVFIAEPISVPENASDQELESKLNELQASLDELVNRGKQWSHSFSQ